MLYDPKWEKPEVKADPFSLESMIAWLEKQPADKVYDFWDCRECLIYQYLLDAGLPRADYGTAHALGGDDIGGKIAHGLPWTFGGALKRARALRAKQNSFSWTDFWGRALQAGRT
jgi:hypothetical protein